MNFRKVRAALRSLVTPGPSDLAARDWRRTVERNPPSDAPIVIFCTPLMGRHMAQDWGAISAGLSRTIDTLLAQTDPNWRLLITSQDMPDPLCDDPRIAFLRYESPVNRPDQLAKGVHMMADLPRRLAGQDAYMHALDADDLMHPDLVAFIRRDNNCRGYWHRDGGMIDARTGLIARCGERTLRYPTSRPFLNHCGSSAAVYVDFRGPRRSEEMAGRFYMGSHRNFRITARAHGITLDAIPFPAALYVMNTGENMRDKRGKMHRKLRYLQQNMLPATTQTTLRTAFGWTGPAPS